MHPTGILFSRNSLTWKITMVEGSQTATFVEYPPSKSISDLVKRLKDRTSRLLQQEFPELQKRYWGRHFWAIGYGAWSTRNLTEEMVAEYLEHHRNSSNQDNDNFLLE